MGVDLSEEMLNVARRKVESAGLNDRISLEKGDAEGLTTIATESVDVATVAFGVRNFEDLEGGLSEMYRAIRRGGKIVVLEFSTPRNRLVRWVYAQYSHHLLPAIGGLISKDKQAYIYLPASYARNKDRRYPVMYMFDGHNVFVDEDATYGKSWGMGEYLDRTNTDLIVIAVECNHEGDGRLQEYAPMDFSNATVGTVKAKGKIYMDWLVQELKPAVDHRLRTLPGRENTLLCGSSMGGLMSLYGATVYNQFFQRAACLSPSLWIAPGKLVELVSKADIRNDTCIYMDYGSHEIYNHAATAEALISLSHLLLSKRVDLTFRIVPGGTHSEASWEQQIPIFMDCLGL